MNLLHMVKQAEKTGGRYSDTLLKMMEQSPVKFRTECPLKFSDDDLRVRLTPLQYEVTQLRGTQRPSANSQTVHKESGIYSCVVCGEALFTSREKFDSGTGWPAFSQVIERDKLALLKDLSQGLLRVEAACARCGAHLGHLFDDGPKPSGLRYCINSVALLFSPQESLPSLDTTDSEAAVCFGRQCSLTTKTNGNIDSALKASNASQKVNGVSLLPQEKANGGVSLLQNSSQKAGDKLNGATQKVNRTISADQQNGKFLNGKSSVTQKASSDSPVSLRTAWYLSNELPKESPNIDHSPPTSLLTPNSLRKSVKVTLL